MAIQFEHLLESLAAAPVILKHGPSADRGDGQVDPRSHPQERGARGDATELHRGRSRVAALRRVLRRSRGGSPAAAAGARTAICARRNLAIAIITRSTSRHRPGSGACERPASGCRWRCGRMPSRSRSSRTRPWRRSGCATTSNAFLPSSRGTAPRPVCMRMRPSAACTCGRS